MASNPCPHCKKNTIRWLQKYLAAKWLIVYCDECGKRSCSQPFVLAIYTMLYVWDVLLFGYLAYLDKNLWYLVVLIVGWLILDAFSVYLPLSPLRQKEQPNK